jgi:hypothetical protein
MKKGEKKNKKRGTGGNGGNRDSTTLLSLFPPVQNGNTNGSKNVKLAIWPGVNAVTDDELLILFEDCSLPLEQWTHRAHVKVAFLYLRDHAFERAVEKMRAGLKAYIGVHDVPIGTTMGYNETTTVAFLHLVAAMMSAYGELFPTPDADTFCDAHPQLMSKHVLRLFYSPERRGLPTAKTQFIEPDLTPLPSRRLGD